MTEKIFKVFVSSTYTDLEDVRNKAILGILKAGHLPVTMEGFSATATQKEMITKKIESCDAYMVIIGSKYGTIDSDTSLSYTEWEYDFAVEKGLPIYTMILSEKFIESRVHSGKISIKDIETSKMEYKAFINKAKGRLADFIDNNEQVKSMSEAGILQLVKDYKSNMIGWVSATALEDLNMAQDELERLRQTRSQLQVKLANAQTEKNNLSKLPDNDDFDNLLTQKFQPNSTDSIIEDGIVYIKEFVEEKVKQLKTKIVNHRGSIALGYDVNKKDTVLFRLDPDSITYIADYDQGIIDVKVALADPGLYETVDRLMVHDNILISENFKETLSIDYLNKTLNLYYKKKKVMKKKIDKK
ncbi:DUF4062 domain-containing protein [Carnobacterium sp. FSL W8-0810]|uniref:DUF4062 domain-containing protein n=1 Tax=Carnobacterium sp. FSL W8-0810 TaxID=2954705 RepID=UPI0030F838A5